MSLFEHLEPASLVPEPGYDLNQPDSQPIGLFQLWPYPELMSSPGFEFDVDIVAIHGLGGHAFGTWTEGQKLWLQDFIPKDISRARVLTFGYNSEDAFTKPTAPIREFAIQLLNSLMQLRQQTTNKSVGLTVNEILKKLHLGGILLKEALIVSHEHSITYSSLASSVAGIVFLGTPNVGPHLPYWSNLLINLANVAFSGRPRQELLDNIELKSSEMGTICSRFVELGPGLPIFSLYEKLTTPVLNAHIVDELSAILRLPNETAVPLEADHQTMGRFLTISNPNYLIVRGCFDDILDARAGIFDSSCFTPKQYLFLRQIRVVNEVDMLHRIPSSWERSHEWFINHQSFKSWTGSQDPRVLWLQGEAGSGKTVLSKEVVLHLNRLSESESHAAIVHKPVYFLNDGSDPAIQCSRTFVCSILYQILKDTKTAFTIRYLEDLDPFRERLVEETLWECLSSIIKRSRGVIFQFVVDGIDKIDPVLEPNGVTLLERLEGLLAADVSSHMRLLITERKVPDDKFLRHGSTSIISMNNENTRQAVQAYVRAQVGGHLESTRTNPLVGAQVEDQIIEISGGNFLMASLSWRWFSNEAQVWIRDAKEIPLKQVYHLPYDLETFYCGLLNMLPGEWREEIRRAFAVLRVSFDRHSSQQLSLFATIWKYDCSSSGFSSRAVKNAQFTFETFLHQRCGDFVLKDKNGLVSFAHQTVKDILGGRPNSAENARILNQYTMSESDAHSVLFQMCMKVLQAESILLTNEEIERIISLSRKEVNELNSKKARSGHKISIWKYHIQKESKTSCLLYALINWFEHYKKATPSVALDLEVVQCLQSSRFHTLWTETTKIDESLEKHMQVVKCASFPLLNAITCGDSGRVIKEIIKSGSEVNILGPQDITPLSWTILCDRKEAFLALMRSDALSVNYGKASQSTAVHYAAMSNNPFYINYMVKDSRANLNCRGAYQTTPLLEALRHKKLGYVLLLLEQPHIDVWAKAGMTENALTLALQHPMWEDVVLRILRMDWSRAMTTIRFDVGLLELVQSYSWHHVEDELLSRNIQILQQVNNHTGHNPVSALAYHGRRADLIRYITKLSYDEVRKVATSGKYNLLHLCANQDWHDLVGELVTNFNLRPVASDHANRTLLHWALDYDWPMSEGDLQILIAGNINQRDNNGMTALHLAISKRNMTVARWLVGAQADIFARDNRGFTPAHLAANEGYREGVEFFMNLTKYDYGRTKEGSTLVHLISLWLDGSLLKEFVQSRSTSVNSKDQKKCMPLHYAAQTGNLSAARVLLEKGSQVNAKDMYGQTALHHAIRSGHLTLPPVLLENGADMSLVDLYGQNCLHLSIRYRHEEFTEWLISWKTDMIFERDKFGFTPLHRACFNGTTREVIELLRRGADILEMDSTFRTPLEHAVNARNHDTIRLILQYRNMENHRAREWIRSVNTALGIAIAKGLPEIEAILMEAGAWVADRSTDRSERFHISSDVREHRWPLVFYTLGDRE